MVSRRSLSCGVQCSAATVLSWPTWHRRSDADCARDDIRRCLPKPCCHAIIPHSTAACSFGPITSDLAWPGSPQSGLQSAVAGPRLDVRGRVAWIPVSVWQSRRCCHVVAVSRHVSQCERGALSLSFAAWFRRGNASLSLHILWPRLLVFGMTKHVPTPLCTPEPSARPPRPCRPRPVTLYPVHLHLRCKFILSISAGPHVHHT